MKIVFLSDDFPPNSRGGAEINAFNLAIGLCAQGHSLTIITITQDRAEVGRYEYRGLIVYKIYSRYHRLFVHYFAIYNPLVIPEVRRILRMISPDIAHAHNIHSHLSFYSLKLARQFSKGVFLTAHDTMLVSYGKVNQLLKKDGTSGQSFFLHRLRIQDHIRSARKRYNPFRNILIRHYLRYVDKIFANTGILKHFLELNGISNIEVMHYGTDIHSDANGFSVGKFKDRLGLINKNIVLFGGRLSREKGGEVAVRVMELVNKLVPETILLIAGRQEEYARYMAILAKQLGIAQHIVFAGWLSREEMNLAYASANVVITPSIYFDAFNLFNLEAMAAGKPVVGTCFGGTPEVIRDGVTGYVVNPFDINETAKKIARLLKQPEIAHRFGEAGKRRVQSFFTLELQVQKTLEWYRKIAQN